MSNEEVRNLEAKPLETIRDTKWWRVEAFGTLEPQLEQLEKELGPVDKTKNPLPNKLKGKIARKLALAWASSENSKAINETSSSKDKNKPIIIPAN